MWVALLGVEQVLCPVSCAGWCRDTFRGAGFSSVVPSSCQLFGMKCFGSWEICGNPKGFKTSGQKQSWDLGASKYVLRILFCVFLIKAYLQMWGQVGDAECVLNMQEKVSRRTAVFSLWIQPALEQAVGWCCAVQWRSKDTASCCPFGPFCDAHYARGGPAHPQQMILHDFDWQTSGLM